jgi:hypothetical protein
LSQKKPQSKLKGTNRVCRGHRAKLAIGRGIGVGEVSTRETDVGVEILRACLAGRRRDGYELNRAACDSMSS